MSMFYYVYFVDDKIKQIVESSSIHKFDGIVDKKKKYKVKWKDGQYYQALILNEAKTESELKQIVEEKRQRPPTSTAIYSQSESETEDLEENRTNTQSSQRNDYKKTIMKKVMDEKLTSMLSQRPSFKNVGVQVDMENRSTADKIDIDKLCDEIKKMKTAIEKLEETVNKCKCTGKNEQAASTSDEVAVGECRNDQVYLGHNTFISASVYNSIVALSGTPQQFVKNMATAIFGIDNLMKSSVHGRAANRTKSKEKRPPLDSSKYRALCDIFRHYLLNIKHNEELIVELQMKEVAKYVARKISDLNRKRKDPNKKNAKKREWRRQNRIIPLEMKKMKKMMKTIIYFLAATTK